MDEQEQLQQLQAEIERLSQQINLCQQDIEVLRRKMTLLAHSKGLMPLPGTGKKTIQKPIQDKQWENFIGLRLIHLVGIVILVIGLSIGVKYAIDRNLMSEAARIVAAYVAGVVLFLLSFWLKKNYTLFSAILFSGAMASLYFTTYAAYVYYGLFSSALAFFIMIALTVFTVYQAMRYNQQQIALLGLVGGYGIPFLISKNADRADLFFLYILVINSGVVFLSIKKQWQLVGQAAMALTWLLFWGWASWRYEPKWQGVGTLFLVLFFLLFSLLSISYKAFYRQPLKLHDTYQIVLNNIALYLGAVLIFNHQWLSAQNAIVSLLLSFIVAAQALALYFVWKDEVQTRRMLAGLALLFFVVFIGSQWKGLTVTLLWLLTSVVVFAWGVWRKSGASRMAAILLMGATLLKLVLFDSMRFSPVQKVISYIILGILLLVVSFFYQKFKQQLFNDEE